MSRPPTADEINALPEPIRSWVHELQTVGDPAGRLRENVLVREENKALRAKLALMAAEPQWIVNDLGELGVFVNGRCFFLYKGRNIEYTGHDDGAPMLVRWVGKREFGETVWPDSWMRSGRRQDRYTVELAKWDPALDDAKDKDPRWDWRPIDEFIQCSKELGDG